MRILTDPSVGRPTSYRERSYVQTVLETAARQDSWPASLHTAVVLSAHRRHRAWPTLDRLERPLIVALGDEDASLNPQLVERGGVVLQCYRPAHAHSPRHVLRLPLGPGGPPPHRPSRSWADRELDVVFVGHLHRRRWELARELGWVTGPLAALPDVLLPTLRARLLDRPAPRPLPHRRTVIQFTDGFGHGLSPDLHLDLLARARIALVPPGFKQDETFRHHEAARAGCVLVGAPVMEYPVVPTPPTGSLLGLLDQLLTDAVALHAQHVAVWEAWRSRGAPEAVGARLAPRIAAVYRPPGT